MTTSSLLNKIRSRIEYHGQPQQIQQLCLDGLELINFSNQICELICRCTKTEYLTLNQCNLKTFQNFPKLNNLIALQAIDNQIQGNDLAFLTQFSHLSFISLDNNKISKIQEIKPLKYIPNLQHLQINNNPITDIPNYRQVIFDQIQTLKILNGQDVFGDSEVLYENSDDDTQSQHQSDFSQQMNQQQPGTRKFRRI